MAAALPDSVRVEVGLGDGARVAEPRPRAPPDRHAAPAGPAPGETASGYSCVAPVRGGRLSRETLHPVAIRPPVRPASTPPGQRPVPPREASGGSRPARRRRHRRVRIVVAALGQQVDPDVGGRCAAWQRRNPKRSVWIEVNREAIRSAWAPTASRPWPSSAPLPSCGRPAGQDRELHQRSLLRPAVSGLGPGAGDLNLGTVPYLSSSRLTLYTLPHYIVPRRSLSRANEGFPCIEQPPRKAEER